MRYIAGIRPIKVTSHGWTAQHGKKEIGRLKQKINLRRRYVMTDSLAYFARRIQNRFIHSDIGSKGIIYQSTYHTTRDFKKGQVIHMKGPWKVGIERSILRKLVLSGCQNIDIALINPPDLGCRNPQGHYTLSFKEFIEKSEILQCISYSQRFINLDDMHYHDFSQQKIHPHPLISYGKLPR